MKMEMLQLYAKPAAGFGGQTPDLKQRDTNVFRERNEMRLALFCACIYSVPQPLAVCQRSDVVLKV